MDGGREAERGVGVGESIGGSRFERSIRGRSEVGITTENKVTVGDFRGNSVALVIKR